jgi:predicted HTH transcriptional regulator
MNIQELEALVDKGESQRLEFKQSTGQRTNAARAVCAMLNDIGGCVLFGVRDYTIHGKWQPQAGLVGTGRFRVRELSAGCFT